MRLNSTIFFPSLFAFASSFGCTPAAFQAHLPSNAKVTYTRTLPANSTFEVPASDIAYPTSPQGLPALCAIQVNLTSSPTSAFSFGLFLPQETWNHRFLAVGNGGFAGGINWLDMAAGVGYGFASMSTDTGHNSSAADISWAYHEPEKQIDFGYRAMHGSVVLAKKLVEAFYGCGIEFNYYSGCSTGGRQGLKEVEMYPEDFDGVLAGAPAWWTAHLQPWTVQVAKKNLPVTADYNIPVELFPAIGAEVLKQCDTSDGLRDNIIMNPALCDFEPETLLCGPNVTNQTEAGCLTAPQISTLYSIYNDYVDVNQTFVFPHLELGSEAQWPVLLGSYIPNPLGYEYPQYMLGYGPNWNYSSFDYSVVQDADRTDPGNCSATDYDLSPFEAKGGKLITYQGYADALIPTGSSIYFYKEVLKTLYPKGVEIDGFFRHFLIPGMQHCAETPPDMNGPWYIAGASQAGTLYPPGAVHSVPGFEDAQHDVLLALMAWTEKGVAPDQVIATVWENSTIYNEVLRQRPICPYPKEALYQGGDEKDPGNWKCGYLYDRSAQYEGVIFPE